MNLRRLFMVAGLLVLLFSGCTYDPTYRGIRCTYQRVCPMGYVCVGYDEDAYCVIQDRNDAGPDAGSDDQPPADDSGNEDAGVDAGGADPGADDGQTADIGPQCDTDGDGHAGPQCGGADCDDLDLFVFPGAPEGPSDSPTCSDLKDNDCDQLTDRNDPGCFRSWWDPDFIRRRRISFLNSDQSESLEEFPVLVKLDPVLLNYSLVGTQGWDLRFVDDDGATVLAHEIESWTFGGDSLVWVKVPRIEGGSDQDYMWLYYGDSQAQDVQDPAGVWSPGYQAVYHLDGLHDSSASGFDLGNLGTVDTSGQIGQARFFDGNAADYLDMGSDLPLLMGVGGWTLAAWVKADQTSTDDNYVISISVHSEYATDASRASLGLTATDEVLAGGRAGDAETYHYTETNSSPIDLGKWYHLTGVTEYSRHNGRIRIYLDGQLERALNINFSQGNSSDTTASNNAIGTQDNATEDFFWGIIDEVRVSPLIRSSDWIAAQYLTQSLQFLEFSLEESY